MAPTILYGHGPCQKQGILLLVVLSVVALVVLPTDRPTAIGPRMNVEQLCRACQPTCPSTYGHVEMVPKANSCSRICYNHDGKLDLEYCQDVLARRVADQE